MTVKTEKKTYKKIDSGNRCVTCDRACSMSGLCMKRWPEFDIPKEKGGRK